MVLHESKYAKIELDDDLSMITHTWTYRTTEMVEKDFKDEMTILADFFKKYRPKRVLVDQRNFFFTILPALQQWIDINVNKILYDNNCQKVAFVVSPDVLAKLTTDQTFESGYSSQLNVKFFDNIVEAREWIKQD